MGGDVEVDFLQFMLSSGVVRLTMLTAEASFKLLDHDVESVCSAEWIRLHIFTDQNQREITARVLT